MTTWDYLASHPDISHVSYLDDTSVLELFDRARIDPKEMEMGGVKQQVMLVYDRHPTHWILFTIYYGYEKENDNGYAALAFAKKHYTRDQADERFTRFLHASGAKIHTGLKRDWPEPRDEIRNSP